VEGALCRGGAALPEADGGRPPKDLEMMLRIYCLQLWFDLSDLAAEEALYDSRSMRGFAGIDLGKEPVPGETTDNLPFSPPSRAPRTGIPAGAEIGGLG
jgi:hypothetical protein